MTDQNSQFFAILTAVGEAKQANAAALGTSWTFAQMAVGDANGTDPIPSRTQTKLINERRRAPLNQVKVDPANASVIIAEQIIPEGVGGWWVRELALYDADGDMVAVANCAPTYKPLVSQGSGRTQVIRINLIVSSTGNIELKIDPSVVLATREYVDTSVIEAMAKMDFKYSVLLATTANITLSGLQTIDGGLTPADARVLVKNQLAAKENGLYVSSAGAWKRAQDADTSIEVTPGLFVSVETGTVNGDSVWQLVTDAPIVLGTTALTFEVVAGRTGIVAGTYRSLTVDKLGRVIAGTNPTTLAGAGITDAMPLGAGGLMSIAQVVAGAISNLPATQFFGAAEGNTTDLPAGINYAVGLHIKYGGPVGAYAFDIISSVTAEDYKVRFTGAGGPGLYRTLWHSGNYQPSDYIKKGQAVPAFSNPAFGSGNLGAIGAVSTDLTGSLQVTNEGNPAASAAMCFHRMGTFAAYFGLDTDNQFKVGGASMGLVSHTLWHSGNRPKDTALLAPTGWSKNADTGEINQWIEYVISDIGGTSLVNVTWPFKFPSQCLNVRPSLRLAAGAQAALGVSFSDPTATGCTVRIEEWVGAIQTGLVLMVEARGF